MARDTKRLESETASLNEEGDEGARRQVDAFAQQVSAALDHAGDAQWLGIHSPLAAPYLLGGRLDRLSDTERNVSPAQRGAILREVMNEAAAAMEDTELRVLIENRYLRRNQFLSNTGIALRTGVSERTFYRLRNRAIADFSKHLYALLVPPLRLERPAPAELVGRRALLGRMRTALAAGDAIYLSGASGMGKSTLAAHFLESAGADITPFWFTVRPGFNDHFASFLFALAFFLHNQGAPNTWRQIIADNDRPGAGTFGIERALSLLRHDFAILSRRVLLCIDEVDLLRPEIVEHNRMMAMLDDLKGIAPGKATLLFVGQRVVVDTPLQLTLPAFEVGEVREWAVQSRLPRLNEEQVRRLAEVTTGSPLMLVLFAALVASGEEVDSLLITFDSEPSLEALLMRIWRRLEEGERALLMQLATFDIAAPADAWREEEGRITLLIERGLLSKTPADLLLLSSHLRPLIYARIPAELRRLFHANASRILEERGNITGAMRQALAAHNETRTLQLWLTHREEQIARGQGNTALEILEQIAASDLSNPAHATALAAMRSELLLRDGRAEEVVAALSSLRPTDDNSTDAYIKYLLASGHEALSNNEKAAALLDQALELLTPPVALARIRSHRMQAYLSAMRIRDMQNARRHAHAARTESELLQAWVEELSGNSRQAIVHYRSALAFAQDPKTRVGMLTRIHGDMGRALMNQGRIEEGIHYMREAIRGYEEEGNLDNVLTYRFNIAYGETISGKPEQGFETALAGLMVAMSIRKAHYICGLAAAAGEAAVYANRWEDAERYLNLSLQQEEEFFRPWALTALGVLRGKQGQHQEAVRWLTEAAEQAEEIEDMHGVAYALQPLFESQRALGNMDGARASIARAHELYTSLGMEPKALETGELLAELG